jgi:hypothetical protein
MDDDSSSTIFRRARQELEQDFDQLMATRATVEIILTEVNRRLFWISASIRAMADLTGEEASVDPRFLERPSLYNRRPRGRPLGPRGLKPPHGGRPNTRLRRAKRALDALSDPPGTPNPPPDPENR